MFTRITFAALCYTLSVVLLYLPVIESNFRNGTVSETGWIMSAALALFFALIGAVAYKTKS